MHKKNHSIPPPVNKITVSPHPSTLDDTTTCTDISDSTSAEPSGRPTTRVGMGTKETWGCQGGDIENMGERVKVTNIKKLTVWWIKHVNWKHKIITTRWTSLPSYWHIATPPTCSCRTPRFFTCNWLLALSIRLNRGVYSDSAFEGIPNIVAFGLGGGGGEKLDNLWNKKAQNQLCWWQHTRVDKKTKPNPGASEAPHSMGGYMELYGDGEGGYWYKWCDMMIEWVKWRVEGTAPKWSLLLPRKLPIVPPFLKKQIKRDLW